MKTEVMAMIRFDGMVVRDDGETKLMVSVMMNPEREERHLYRHEVPVGHAIAITSVVLDADEAMTVGASSKAMALDVIEKARRPR